MQFKTTERYSRRGNKNLEVILSQVGRGNSVYLINELINNQDSKINDCLYLTTKDTSIELMSRYKRVCYERAVSMNKNIPLLLISQSDLTFENIEKILMENKEVKTIFLDGELIKNLSYLDPNKLRVKLIELNEFIRDRNIKIIMCHFINPRMEENIKDILINNLSQYTGKVTILEDIKF